MSIEVQIVGKTGRLAEVSPLGQLVTAPLAYATGTFQDMGTVDTAFNFVTPTPGKRFVITGLLISTNRNVGVNGAIIIIYEAASATSTTVDKTLAQVEMTKNQLLPIPGLNSIVTEGKFVNGKTDDDDVSVTLSGYEVDA